MEHHSTRAGRALSAKIINDAMDEADLYAALLLTLLSCLYKDVPKFIVHLNGFVAILKELTRKASNHGKNRHLSRVGHLSSVFLPLARDLILEMSRRLRNTNDLVIEFSYTSQLSIGSPTFEQRIQYHDELLGTDPHNYLSFCHAVWHHLTVLRRYFRHAVFQHIENLKLKFSVQVLVSEIKADLRSHSIQYIVVRLLSLKHDPLAFINSSDSSYDLFTFTLLLYHFCFLLIIMMEAETVSQGAISLEATSLATLMLPPIDDTWLEPNTYDPNVVPWGVRGPVLIRILCILGLTIRAERFPEGT